MSCPTCSRGQSAGTPKPAPQLLAAQDFTCKSFRMCAVAHSSRYTHENKEFWGWGEGVSSHLQTHQYAKKGPVAPGDEKTHICQKKADMGHGISGPPTVNRHHQQGAGTRG